MEGSEISNNHLMFLVAAYSLVWIMISAYVLVLGRRNEKLEEQVEDFERRLAKYGASSDS